MAQENLTVLDERLSEERAYWLGKLAGEPAAASLPADYPAARAAGRRAALPLALDPRLGERLVAVCGGRDSLLLASLIAVIRILLSKLTGLADFVVGTTIHKQHSDVAALNRLLALRDRLAPEATLREVLATAKQTLAEAYAHQKFPFQRLVSLLDPERQGGGAPLFSVAILLVDINDREHAATPGLEVVFLFRRTEGGLDGTIEYEAERFRPATIELAARQLGRTVELLLGSPDAKLSEIDLATPEEAERILVACNDTAADYPLAAVDELIARQAARTPLSVALALGDRTCSYRDLDRRASALARDLARHGIGSGDRVGIFLEHSFEMVAAVLAVLATGAAYVPLDPEHPPSRVELMLADSAAVLVLTATDLACRLPAGTRTLCLDWAAWPQEVEEYACALPCRPGAPERVAYILYTSGSTGRPKGVEVQHRALVNYLTWAEKAYFDGEPLAFALYTSLTFDLTVTSLFDAAPRRRPDRHLSAARRRVFSSRPPRRRSRRPPQADPQPPRAVPRQATSAAAASAV